MYIQSAFIDGDPDVRPAATPTRRILLCISLWLAGLLSVTKPAAGMTLSLGQAISDATESSFDARIARVRILQLRADIKAAWSDYFPSLVTAATTEYDKGLRNSPQSVFSVGNTTFNAVTRFQELGSLQASCTLLDFGARANALKAARRNHEAARIVPNTIIRDLRLSVIDTYSNALTTYKELRTKQDELPVYRELFEIKQKTCAAGTTTRVELGEQAVQLAQAEDAVRQLREELTAKLRALTQLTHTNYSLNELEMSDLDDLSRADLAPFEPKATPDFQQYEKQIQAKRAELGALFAQRLPQIRAYGGYVVYGTDKNSLSSAIGGLGARMMNAGVSAQWTIFDGFKNMAQCERKRYEIQEIQVQRDKKLWDLQTQYETASASLEPLAAELSTKAEVVTKGQQKVHMYERLTNSQMTDRTLLLAQRAQLLEQQLAHDKVRIQKAAAKEKMKTLVGM